MSNHTKPRGGVGTNQYQVRGKSLSPHAPPPVPVLVSARCCDIWGGKCQTMVYPPHYDHGVHPDGQTKRNAVQGNDLPAAVLAGLADDHDEVVRIKVGINADTPAAILLKLIQDPNRYVQYAVIANRNAPTHFLTRFARDSDPIMRRVVAENNQTPPSVLELLADDSEALVRVRVASHLNTPPAILSRLVNDSNPQVRSRASNNPNVEIIASASSLCGQI